MAIPNSHKLNQNKNGSHNNNNKNNNTDRSDKLMDTKQNIQKEQRARLIGELGKFKPQDANPLQFYNCVREFCIMHNCSIDEGMDRAFEFWPTLSMRQRALYNSQRHAELPIPVPRHLIYRAFQMERNGRWSLGRAPVGNNGATMYTVESYKPPQKITKFHAHLKAKKPKYDNMIDPLISERTAIRKKAMVTGAAAAAAGRIQYQSQSQSLPGTSRKVHTLTSSQQKSMAIGHPTRHANSISRMMSVKPKIKLMKTNRSCPGTGNGNAGAGGDGGYICDRKTKKAKSNKKATKRNSTSKKKTHKKKTIG